MSAIRALTRSERLLAALSVLCVLAASAAVAAKPAPENDSANRAAPAFAPPGVGPVTTRPPDPPPDVRALPEAGAVTTLGPTFVLGEPRPDAGRVSVLRDGIVLPVTDHEGTFYAVLTPCEIQGWVAADGVRPHVPSPEGAPATFGDATFVLDPGHGGRDPGAVGPGGLTESEINLTISNRIVELMLEPRAIAPDRRVVLGDSYPPPRVFLTRDSDFTARLGYRTAIANALGAHALVSIHNNAAPDGSSDRPGTETFFQIASPDSRRLAGLIYEELVAVLEPYGGPWVADRDAGAKYRPNSRGGDYYGILRMATGPSVLVEALFISNPHEEALLRRDDVQQDIAEAVYRALARFITTDDPGSGFVEPYPRSAPASGGQVRCTDPA